MQLIWSTSRKKLNHFIHLLPYCPLPPLCSSYAQSLGYKYKATQFDYKSHVYRCLIIHHFLCWFWKADIAVLTYLSCQHNFVISVYMKSLSKTVLNKTIHQPNHLSLKHNSLAESKMSLLEYSRATPMTGYGNATQCPSVQHEIALRLERIFFQGNSWWRKNVVMASVWKTARCHSNTACKHSRVCVLTNLPTKRCQNMVKRDLL